MKIGEINKIKALSDNTIIHILSYRLFNVLKTVLYLIFGHFLDSWVETCQIFRCFFRKSMTLQRHSEINRPLVDMKKVKIDFRSDVKVVHKYVSTLVWIMSRQKIKY